MNVPLLNQLPTAEDPFKEIIQMSLFSVSLQASSSEDASNQGVGNLMLTTSHGTHLDLHPLPPQAQLLTRQIQVDAVSTLTFVILISPPTLLFRICLHSQEPQVPASKHGLPLLHLFLRPYIFQVRQSKFILRWVPHSCRLTGKSYSSFGKF